MFDLVSLVPLRAGKPKCVKHVQGIATRSLAQHVWLLKDSRVFCKDDVVVGLATLGMVGILRGLSSVEVLGHGGMLLGWLLQDGA